MYELKWLITGFAVVMSAIAVSTSVDTYANKMCRIEAIKANVDTDKIDQACGKK